MAEKKVLNIKDILAVDDVVYREVEVPEWGGVVLLRSLSGADALKMAENKDASQPGSGLKIVMMAAVQEDRVTPLFENEEQFEAFRRKNLRAILRLQKVALEISGLTDVAEEAAKNV